MSRKERFVICVESRDEWGKWEETAPIELCKVCSAFAYDMITHAKWHAAQPVKRRSFVKWVTGKH